LELEIAHVTSDWVLFFEDCKRQHPALSGYELGDPARVRAVLREVLFTIASANETLVFKSCRSEKTTGS